jgi:hypothetical protein
MLEGADPDIASLIRGAAGSRRYGRCGGRVLQCAISSERMGDEALIFTKTPQFLTSEENSFEVRQLER